MKYDYIRPAIATSLLVIGILYFTYTYISSLVSQPEKVVYLTLLPLIIALTSNFILIAFDIFDFPIATFLKVHLPIIVFGIFVNLFYLNSSASYFDSKGYSKVDTRSQSSLAVVKWVIDVRRPDQKCPIPLENGAGCVEKCEAECGARVCLTARSAVHKLFLSEASRFSDCNIWNFLSAARKAAIFSITPG